MLIFGTNLARFVCVYYVQVISVDGVMHACTIFGTPPPVPISLGGVSPITLCQQTVVRVDILALF